jgi:hypothetical protein
VLPELLLAPGFGRAYNRGVAVQRMFVLCCSRLSPAPRPQGRAFYQRGDVPNVSKPPKRRYPPRGAPLR